MPGVKVEESGPVISTTHPVPRSVAVDVSFRVQVTPAQPAEVPPESIAAVEALGRNLRDAAATIVEGVRAGLAPMGATVEALPSAPHPQVPDPPVAEPEPEAPAPLDDGPTT